MKNENNSNSMNNIDITKIKDPRYFNFLKNIINPIIKDDSTILNQHN